MVAMMTGTSLKLRTWWMREELDEKLAHGADPESDHMLSRRAEQLTSRKTRTRTAIDRLNAELYNALGLDVDETRTLVAALTKMRRVWGDYQGDYPGEEDAGSAHLHVAQSSA